MNTPALISPVVTIVDGKTITSSNDVAVYFGKQHKNVIQSIDALIVEVGPEFTELNFQPMINVIEIGNGATRKDKAFALTRDGFTLLAMGFTGKKALHFKLEYIAAFNAMEAKLKQGVSPSDPADVAMRSMIGKQFLMTVCALPDGRTFHSIQPVLDPSFVVRLKDIPELLARHGLSIVQKDALDGLTRFTA